MSRQAHDTSARLRDIVVPTLVMVGGDETHGSSDTTHVQSSQALANGIPNAKFVVLEKQGHFYTFSDAANMNKIVRDFISTSAA
jgi:pimeloyl-ACP methyl ester carboxylesterase